jgi:hydrogenase expression/formation protein HypE
MPITDTAEMDKKVLLGHGSGGKLSHELISNIFVRHFNNNILSEQTDSAIVRPGGSELAFTTDSFVVDPIFFPGGNIGTLAVAGTVNDLAVAGAEPQYLSASFIIEEGLSLDDLETIVISMAKEAARAGIKIVTGDTKVVNRGKCDKVFINSSGIGRLDQKYRHIGTGILIQPGDRIIINGSVGDHGMSVLAAREFLNLRSDIKSDCACLNHLIKKTLDVTPEIRFMRDATRGGVATILAELVHGADFGIEIDEAAIPVKENVMGMCELLGYDPLYVANEGKVVMIVPAASAENVIEALRTEPEGKEAKIIGEVVDQHPGKAWVYTSIGGRRILDMLAGEQLPRIC